MPVVTWMDFAIAKLRGAGSILSADPPSAGPRRGPVKDWATSVKSFEMSVHLLPLAGCFAMWCEAFCLQKRQILPVGKKGEEQEHRKKKRQRRVP